jgi:hypothetical protein
MRHGALRHPIVTTQGAAERARTPRNPKSLAGAEERAQASLSGAGGSGGRCCFGALPLRLRRRRRGRLLEGRRGASPEPQVAVFVGGGGGQGRALPLRRARAAVLRWLAGRGGLDGPGGGATATSRCLCRGRRRLSRAGQPRFGGARGDSLLLLLHRVRTFQSAADSPDWQPLPRMASPRCCATENFLPPPPPPPSRPRCCSRRS